MRIVEVTADEIKTLESIGRTTYLDHYSEIWTPRGIEDYLHRQFDRDKLKNDLRDANIRYFIAQVEEKPVGFLKIKSDRKIPKAMAESGLELEKIYLLKEFAGRGLGSALMDFIVVKARELNEKLVWLDVLKSNVRGIKFYRENGFEIVDELEFATDKTEIGMWVMKKTLVRN